MHRIFSHKVVAYLMFLLVVDLTIMPLFRIGPVQPAFSYLIIPYAAFQWGWRKTVPISIFVGLLRDLVSSSFLGLETLSLAAMAILLDAIVQKADRHSWPARLMTIFFFISGAHFFVLLFTIMMGRIDLSFSGYRFLLILWAGFYSMAAAPLFFFMTSKWFGEKTTLREYELFK